MENFRPSLWDDKVLNKIGMNYMEFFRRLGVEQDDIEQATVVDHPHNIKAAIINLFARYHF